MSLVIEQKQPVVLLEAPELPEYRITIPDAAIAERKAALEASQEIVSVTNQTELADAIAAASMLKSLEKQMDATHKSVKEPVLTIGRAIDTAKKGFNDTLIVERARVEKLANTYQRECNAKAEQLKAEELAEIAKRNAEAMAENDTDTLRESAMRVSELSQKPKVEGAMMKEFYDYTVTDIDALYEASRLMKRDFVKVEPRRAELLAFINAPGFISLPGIVVERKVSLHAKA